MINLYIDVCPVHCNTFVSLAVTMVNASDYHAEYLSCVLFCFVDVASFLRQSIMEMIKPSDIDRLNEIDKGIKNKLNFR